MLDAHYATGDGRGNENVSLTVVHHIFHGEHNLVADHVKEVALTSGDISLLNDWLLTKLSEADGQGRDTTLVEGDVNGDGVADFQITLMGGGVMNQQPITLRATTQDFHLHFSSD